MGKHHRAPNRICSSEISKMQSSSPSRQRTTVSVERCRAFRSLLLTSPCDLQSCSVLLPFISFFLSSPLLSSHVLFHVVCSPFALSVFSLLSSSFHFHSPLLSYRPCSFHIVSCFFSSLFALRVCFLFSSLLASFLYALLP